MQCTPKKNILSEQFSFLTSFASPPRCLLHLYDESELILVFTSSRFISLRLCSGGGRTTAFTRSPRACGCTCPCIACITCRASSPRSRGCTCPCIACRASSPRSCACFSSGVGNRYRFASTLCRLLLLLLLLMVLLHMRRMRVAMLRASPPLSFTHFRTFTIISLSLAL